MVNIYVWPTEIVIVEIVWHVRIKFVSIINTFDDTAVYLNEWKKKEVSCFNG